MKLLHQSSNGATIPAHALMEALLDGGQRAQAARALATRWRAENIARQAARRKAAAPLQPAPKSRPELTLKPKAVPLPLP